MMNNYFSKEDTKVIKGITIILMMMHHLWAFPGRISGGELKYFFEILGQSSISYLGMFSKICVSIFFFLGGYGIYKSSQNRKFDLVKKIKNLYISYWKVFIIFIPIAFLFFSKQPLYCEVQDICNKYETFSVDELLKNFFALSSSYNGEWWFLKSYICAVITYPFVEKIIKNFSISINIALIIIGGLLVGNIFPLAGQISLLKGLNDNYLYSTFFCQTSPYIMSFWMGIVVAKDDVLLKLKNSLKENNLLNPFFDIIFFVVIIYLRNTGTGSYLDIIYVPIIIVCSLDFIQKMKIVKKIFMELGKKSTNMWLIHTFFCYYFYKVVKIIVTPKYAVVCLGLLLLFSYIAALLVDFFWKIINTIVCKIMGNIKCYFLLRGK